MPQLLTSRRVRCRVTVGAPFTTTPLSDAFTSQTLESVRGNATRFEFGFFDVLGTALDLSEVQSLNLKLQPSQTVDSPLADKTITVLDLTLDAATWDDGSKEHAVFQFSNAEMNIDPQGERRTLWLVITAITIGGDEVTLTGGAFFLHEDNNGSLATPPENPGAYLTVEQGDARYYAGSIIRTLAEGPPENAVATGNFSFPGMTAPAHANEMLIRVGLTDEWTNDGIAFSEWVGNPAQKYLTITGGIWRLLVDEIPVLESEDDGAELPWLSENWYTIGSGVATSLTPVLEMSGGTTATAVDQRCHVTDGGGNSLIYTATVAGVGTSKWKLTGPAGVQEDPNIPGAYVIAAPDSNYATAYTTYTPS